MKVLGVGWFLLAAALAYAGEPGITTRPEPVAPVAGARKAVQTCPTSPTTATAPAALTPLPSDSGWTLADSLVLHRLIPAGERLVVQFDSAFERLQDTLLPEFLTETARRAVSVAPDWLKDDLTDNFRRMAQPQQNSFGDLILNCPDKRYYDEVCFQVAHLSPAVLSVVPPQLLVDNVQFAYQIDRELSYVDIEDYGDPVQGGNYYSTTRYRAIVSGETTLVEIPREIYYWWVIMPKGTDEPPQYVYGQFWRQYLFYYADSGYPLLREKLARTSVLWNGQQGWWSNSGQPFPDTLPAVAVIGRWCALTVPDPAEGNRPIQPNQIAHEHNGNCGETQDVLWAAARTALIPCGGVCDINEDHVWCEIWWQGEFFPWQVDLGCGPTNIKNPGIAYDRKYGGSKEVSGVWEWRNDGLQRSVVGTYSDVCTLTVEVRDSVGRPVDGAVVQLQSEGWQTSELYNCFFGVTDRSGRYTTTLGDWQNYYLAVVSTLGGLTCGQVIDSANCVPGTHFFYACSLAGRLDSLSIVPDSGTPLDRYRLDVTYSVGREVLYGRDCYNSGGPNEYALVCSTGAVDFFVASQEEFDRYRAGEAFQAFAVDENVSAGQHSLVLTRNCNHYAVLSNEEQANLTAFVDVTARLYRRGTGIAETEPVPVPRLGFGPSPFQERLQFELSSPNGEVEVFDRTGRRVQKLSVRQSRAFWDGTDIQGRVVPAGVYFCRVAGQRNSMNRPIVFLGRQD